MPREYRSLLPAPDNGSAADPTAPAPEMSAKEVPKRKRIGVAVACNLCRSKKTRCDGARPVCGLCQKRGAVKCSYSDKRDANDETREIMELLKSEPESVAIDILKILRSNHDPTTVLSLVSARHGGKQEHPPSSLGLGAPTPQSYPMETELVAKNPILYPVMHSLFKPTLMQSHLLRSVSSPTDPAVQPGNAPDTTHSIGADNPEIDSDSAIRRFRRPLSQADLTKHGSTLCDERLHDLDISFWTTVPIPNNLAAKVISLYLVTDHPLLGTFEPRQFIADLVNHGQTSCSHFLANTLLYWGCQMYSAIEKEANEYAQQLSAEAVHLWTIEKNCDSILTMIGAQMLSLAYMGNGKDHDVLVYQIESVRMGARLGLLGVDEDTAAVKLAELSEEKLKAYSFAAWGVFNWAMLVTVFYRQPGLVYLKFPPTLPIPGDSGRASPESSGTSSSGVSSGKTPEPYILPSYMGNTFPAVCEFWRIMREVCLAYFSAEGDPMDHVSLDFAELKYREILAWAENLPLPILRDVDSPHHVMVLHMWIHAAITDIFRPFVQREEVGLLRLKTFSAADSSPKAAYKASVNQLRQLIFYYRSNYEESTYSILWQTALTYVAIAALHDNEDPTWRSWFLLCMYGYETLRRPFRITESIGRALLTMTMRDTDITSDDARKLLDELKERGLSSNIEEGIRATFMGDLSMAPNNPEGARMENLASSFEEMALFKDFINVPGDSEMTQD
ncbi:hypothetical protein AB5N19_02476 [Seiridium cardinale]